MKWNLPETNLINRALIKRNFANSSQLWANVLPLVVLPLVVLPLTLVAYAAAGGVPTDPDIAAILSNVDSNRIQNTALTLQNFRTRQSCSDQPEPGHGVTAARDFILAQYIHPGAAS